MNGLFAWYQSDHNESFSYHSVPSMERNDSVAQDELLLFLSFDESNGSHALDKSGNQYHGKLLDQSIRTSGKFGEALTFDGDNDGLAFSKVEYLDTPEAFTISFWFQRDSDINGTENETNHFVNNVMLAQSSAAYNDNLEIGSEGSEFEIYLDSGTGAQNATYTTSGASITNGVWHHFTMTYGSDLKIFADGNMVLQQAYDGPLTSVQDSPLSIGMARIYSDQWGDFNGSIDDFRIYRKELNATEIGQLFNNGSGDFSGSVTEVFSDGLVSEMKDFSGNQRHALSKYVEAPKITYDLNSGKKLLQLDYGKKLMIPDAVSMPITLFIYGRETGLSFPDREHFTSEGWRFTNNNAWTLRRWSNNNPAINGNINSTIHSVVAWTISRYSYELRVNGEQIATSASANWNPDSLFDRINEDGALELGEFILFPRLLEDSEKFSIEAYLGHKWGLISSFPSAHPYRNDKPIGKAGLVLNGSAEKAGTFNITATASNLWGSVSQNFNMTINALPPRIRTTEAREIGSTSARLLADLVDMGGEDVTVSFLWGTDPNNLINETNARNVSSEGETSTFLSGLSPNTSYYFQSKALNSAGISNGDAITDLPYFYWELNDTNSIALDSAGRSNGEIFGAESQIDPDKGRVLNFDGDDDYINMGDLDELDQIDRFTVSLWFNRASNSSNTPTNHQIHNVLLAQSSSTSNDNLEIGSFGSSLQLYVDTGSADTEGTVTFDAGISNNQWYHLTVLYGSELSLYLNGTKITTWTHYNGRLESSATSPFSIGAARPNSDIRGDFNGMLHDFRIYLSELTDEEIKILAHQSAPQSFTTGSSAVPPIIRISPARNITDSNATIGYELVSFDGTEPEVFLYWGDFDHGENSGLWQNSQSLGINGTGLGDLNISGFSSGDEIFYQARAVGTPFDDWADNSGKFRTVSPSLIRTLPAVDQSLSRATLKGELLSNGGTVELIDLQSPKTADGLVGHWRFDEGQGSETYDSTGLAPTAYLNSGVTWTGGMSGAYNNALQFDGGNLAYVDLGDFRIDGALSFSAWVFKEDFGNWQRVFDFGSGPGLDNLYLSNHDSSNQADWNIIRNTVSRTLEVQDFWTLYEWQHVVALVDETGVMSLYRNGELKGSALGHLPRGRTREFQYLGRSNFPNDGYFKGMMDDFRLYERALSKDEVESIYRGDLEEEVIFGGENPVVSLYWGNEDAGETNEVNSSSSTAWDQKVNLGVLETGLFSHALSGLNQNETFFYRLSAENSAGVTWAKDLQTFTTGDFSLKPNSISSGNLLLWLDATDINGDFNQSNEPYGGFVDQWRDKSGASRHAGDGNGPTLLVDRWNSKSTLKFDGIANYLRVQDSDVFDIGQDGTIFIVSQGHDSQNWRPVLSKGGENQMGWQFRKSNTDFASFTIYGTSDWDRRGGTPFNGAPHVWALRKSDVRKSQWADGNLEFEVVDSGSITAAPDYDLVIGARDGPSGITAFASVEVGEILVFDSALTNDQIHKLQGHLAHKWGLTQQMPTSHPYKQSIPLFENRPEILLSSPYSILKDQNVSLFIKTDRVAHSFSAINLPAGLSLDSSTGEITGSPQNRGNFNSILGATNQAGSLSKNITFEINDFSEYPFRLDIAIDGYSGNSTLQDFAFYLELNSSISGFSYEQFASPFGHDLRFLSADGSNELKYEVVEWQPTGTSSFWVLLPELNASTSIQAVWGNRNQTRQPAYCIDGSVWQKYHGVWHMDEDDDNLIRDSKGSFHATPTNFENLKVDGVIKSAVNFDGVDDYLNMSLDSHPPTGTEQLTISFWSYGKLDTLKNSTLFESGSSLGRHLNVHYPWNNSRFYWDVGAGNYDRIEKEDADYLGSWIYWVLQKDVKLGVMRIYKNGVLFAEGLDKTRPITGDVDLFKVGTARTGGLPWKGWLDEFRIGLFIDGPDSIAAAYESQRPDSGSRFSNPTSVNGPPIILKSQLGQGYANDSNRSFSYIVKTFPSADTFSLVGLPAGLSFDASTGEISGVPLQGGTYQVTVTAENNFGQDQGIIQLRFASVSNFSHNTHFDFSGYSGGETLKDFPVFLNFDSSIPKFSLKSFASPQLNDLRFFDNAGRELNYEIETIEEASNAFSVWVQVPEMNASNSVTAYWGDPSLAASTPSYSVNGSTWANDFKGVWHYRPMSLTTTLTDSTYYRNHAEDESGFTEINSILGSGRSFAGGPDQSIAVPSSYSLDDLDQNSYTFSTWIKLENLPDNKASDAFLGIGYETNSNDSYFNEIENLKNLSPSGIRIFQQGPRQGLYIEGNGDFRSLDIGINRDNNYMSLFMAYFKPPETGIYQFRCTDKDDRATIWLDLDRDQTFELSGAQGEEKIGGNHNFTSQGIQLNADANQTYMLAIGHGQGGGGSRLKPWILTPGQDWRIIDPSDPSQQGYYSVPFDGSLSDNLSSFSFFKHGVKERFDFRNGKMGVTHRINNGTVDIDTSYTPDVDQWTHVVAQVDIENQEIK
ncbi:MAG TPA: hypothetical protein DCW45_02410, partial [Opitutae bacterium]|nr:hypothetical protein [Opitutae bacterium]